MPGIILANGGVTNTAFNATFPPGTLSDEQPVQFILPSPMDEYLGRPNPMARTEALLHTIGIENVHLLDGMVKQRMRDQELMVALAATQKVVGEMLNTLRGIQNVLLEEQKERKARVRSASNGNIKRG